MTNNAIFGPAGRTRKTMLLLGAPLLLTACAAAGTMTPQEEAVRQHVDVNQYMPATRQMRDNIETQELFAQAAFWSNEYELNPTDLEATIKLASAVRRLGNPSRAVEITQTARQIHPRDPYLLAEHAAGLIAGERALDAVPILDEGLRRAPAYARLWSLKGAALDQMEQYESARQHYARALQITPNDPNVLANLGLSHALSGDPATAEVWLRRAAAQPGASAGVRQNLALVLQLQGQTEAAAQQTRLSQLSRGERQLPPQPVPALTPRGTPAQMAETTTTAPIYGQRGAPQMSPGQPQLYAPQMQTRPQAGYSQQVSQGQMPQQTASAPPLRGGFPQSRLTTVAPDGQTFTNSREAARGSVGYAQSGTVSGAPVPLPRDGQMTAEQQAVLANIRQSLQPGASAPQPAPQTMQAPQAEQPYLVGPAIQTTQPRGYPTQAAQPSYAPHSQPASRRDPARRRR